MAGAKSLAVLCFLLIIATSQAASCSRNVCYIACRRLPVPKQLCARWCRCTLPSTFFPNELATKEAVLEEMMMEELSLNESPTCKAVITEALAAAEMEVDYNRAETALDKMTMEEFTSMNKELAAKPKPPKCKSNPCYRRCLASGGSKARCARKCRCILVTDALAESKDAKDVDVEASTSTE